MDERRKIWTQRNWLQGAGNANKQEPCLDAELISISWCFLSFKIRFAIKLVCLFNWKYYFRSELRRTVIKSRKVTPGGKWSITGVIAWMWSLFNHTATNLISTPARNKTFTALKWTERVQATKTQQTQLFCWKLSVEINQRLLEPSPLSQTF